MKTTIRPLPTEVIPVPVRGTLDHRELVRMTKRL